MEDVKIHLECPICFEIPNARIFQCLNGHHICEECRKRYVNCPQCSLPYGTIIVRNLPLEAIRDDLREKCPNHEHGCQLQIKRKDRGLHQNVCEFRPMNLCEMLGFENCKSLSDRWFVIYQRRMVLRFLRTQMTSWQSNPDPLCCPLANRNGNVMATKSATLLQFERESGEDPDTLLMCLLRNNRYQSWLCVHIGMNTEDAAKHPYSVTRK